MTPTEPYEIGHFRCGRRSAVALITLVWSLTKFMYFYGDALVS